jgi:hypothetical protein
MTTEKLQEQKKLEMERNLLALNSRRNSFSDTDPQKAFIEYGFVSGFNQMKTEAMRAVRALIEEVNLNETENIKAAKAEALHKLFIKIAFTNREDLEPKKLNELHPIY